MPREQLRRARDLLCAQHIDRALFANPASVTWLTGVAAPLHTGPSPFAGGPPLVWYEGGRFDLIVQDALAPQAILDDVRVLVYQGYTVDEPLAGAENLSTIVRQMLGNTRALGAEVRHAPAFLLPREADLTPIDGWLEPLRMVKTPAEIEILKHNFALTDIGHAAVQRAIRGGAGQREIDVWQAAQSAIETAAGERVPLGNDCVVGYRQNNIGGWPGALPLRPGDSMIVDLGTRQGGYWSDSCGTYYVDEPTPRQRAVHRCVQDALEFAIGLIKPGAVAQEIDQRVRQFIAQAGYPVYPHHTGHGVGVTPHEEVRIVPYNDRVLEAGMVLMLEPGIYFPGEFGVRLEDAMLVTPTGAEVLTKHPR